MTSSTMSAELPEPSFRCPVCRAAQPLQETCRRCRADLRLVLLAHRRLAYVRRAAALASSEDERNQFVAELHWLAPSG
jgi:hypothetical protein